MPFAPTPCLEPGCYNKATYQGRCEDHPRTGWANSTRAERLPKDWPTRRLIVLKRDKGICYLCGNPGADSVDHIINDDDDSLENLAAAHMHVPPYCHRYKSSAEGHTAQAGRRTKPRF